MSVQRFVSFIEPIRAHDLLETLGLGALCPVEVTLDCTASLFDAGIDTDAVVERARVDWPGRAGDMPDGAIVPAAVAGLLQSVATSLQPQWLVVVQPPSAQLHHWAQALGEKLGADYCAVLSGWIDEDIGDRCYVDLLRRQPVSLEVGLPVASDSGVAMSRYSMVDFYGPIPGEGWYEPELVNNVGFRWMNTPGPATVRVPNVFCADADLTVHVPYLLHKKLLRHVRIDINGVSLPVMRSARGRSFCLTARAPRDLLEGGGDQVAVSLSIDTSGVDENLFRSTNNDPRPLSIAISHIELIEVLEGESVAGERGAALRRAATLAIKRMDESETAASYRIEYHGGDPGDSWSGLLDFRDDQLSLRLRAREAGLALEVFAEPWLPRDDSGAYFDLSMHHPQPALRRRQPQDQDCLRQVLGQMPAALARLQADTGSARLRACVEQLLARAEPKAEVSP